MDRLKLCIIRVEVIGLAIEVGFYKSERSTQTDSTTDMQSQQYFCEQHSPPSIEHSWVCCLQCSYATLFPVTAVNTCTVILPPAGLPHMGSR